ncbi:hypothetical protein [Actinoplanes couchii]|uniref:Uncharacterized protein n=1 Tax=Actinoplanes couchii TaxID=403638 RepID=A0ABQ3XTK8_9ACTN|nr:hypothetical protein [Actinoplanes couchii]MDR6318930.1 hypothetical protein [Actinoplanes couchii]GID61838.1 hypothetical protein Aco03nite_102420 [Actinoplanes couchii]
MPKPAWYVITESTPTTEPAHLPDAVRVILALETMRTAADHLAAALPHADALLTNPYRLATILHTYNQVLAAAAQTTGRLAHRLHPGPDHIGGPACDPTAGYALADATSRLIEAAGLFKEAYLAVEHRQDPA